MKDSGWTPWLYLYSENVPVGTQEWEGNDFLCKQQSTAAGGNLPTCTLLSWNPFFLTHCQLLSSFVCPAYGHDTQIPLNSSRENESEDHRGGEQRWQFSLPVWEQLGFRNPIYFPSLLMSQNTMKLMHYSNNYKSLVQTRPMLLTREGTSRANKRGFLPFINMESNESG